MRKLLWLLAAGIAAMLLSGCGSGSNTVQHGSLRVTSALWPAAAR